MVQIQLPKILHPQNQIFLNDNRYNKNQIFYIFYWIRIICYCVTVKTNYCIEHWWGNTVPSKQSCRFSNPTPSKISLDVIWSAKSNYDNHFQRTMFFQTEYTKNSTLVLNYTYLLWWVFLLMCKMFKHIHYFYLIIPQNIQIVKYIL